MSEINESKNEINSVISFIIGCIVASFFLVLSFKQFHSQMQYIDDLKNQKWLSVDIPVTPQTQFEFLHFRTGETRMDILQNSSEFYSQSCNGQINEICKWIEDKKIHPISLNFYTFLKPDSPMYQNLHLNTLTFIDANGREQIFHNMSTTPNSPEFITIQKKFFNEFFKSTFFENLFIAACFIIHNLTYKKSMPKTKRKINYLILAVCTGHYFSFVIRYFLV